MYTYVPLPARTEEQWDQMIDVNMKGLMFPSQAFVLALRAQDRPGKIIS